MILTAKNELLQLCGQFDNRLFEITRYFVHFTQAATRKQVCKKFFMKLLFMCNGNGNLIWTKIYVYYFGKWPKYLERKFQKNKLYETKSTF